MQIYFLDMTNIVCIGEILIDFIAEKQGSDLSKAIVFTKKAGGAPANVATAISKLGGKSKFVGAVGKDPFGVFLINTLKEHSVSTEFVQQVDTFTTLAYVSLAKNGERDFVFNRGADALLQYDKNLSLKFNNTIVHFGAATAFLGGTLEKTYSKYLSEAHKKEAFISFDPNFRIDLWKNNESSFIKKCLPFIEKSNFAKFSLEEAQLISGEKEIEKACHLFHEMGAKIIAVTLGSKGTFLSTKAFQKTIESVKVNSIDTTGAGDAFVGCFLKQLSEIGAQKTQLENVSILTKMIKRANIAGAITTTNYGAISALPTQNQVNNYE